MKRNVIIFFILTLFLLVPSVYAGDFWIDASDVYNTIRTLDSKLGMGISGAEFKRKFEDITVSYDLFMDKYSDKCSLSRYLAMLEKKATGKKKAKIQAEAEYFHENELSFCETLSLVKDQYRLALSSLELEGLSQEYEDLSNEDQSDKKHKARNDFETETGEASKNLMKMKEILNKHR